MGQPGSPLQSRDHRYDPLRDDLQIRIDLPEQSAWFEDVEIAAERNLVSDLRPVVIAPCDRRR